MKHFFHITFIIFIFSIRSMATTNLINTSDFKDAEIQFTQPLKLNLKYHRNSQDLPYVQTDSRYLLLHTTEFSLGENAKCDIQKTTTLKFDHPHYNSERHKFENIIKNKKPIIYSKKIKWKVRSAKYLSNVALLVLVSNNTKLFVRCTQKNSKELDDIGADVYMTLLMNGAKFTKNGIELKPYKQVELGVTHQESPTPTYNYRAAQ